MTSNGFVSLVNLSKSYQEGDQIRPVLKDASLDLQRGEFLAILGKSGSGKSTLLNLISGIDQFDSGEVYINGLSLAALDERQRTYSRRQQIGFIFQFYNLIPTLSVLENVSLPLELLGTNLDEAQEQASRMLAAVGLEDRLKTYPDRLSGGEQQRVAISRALIHNPLIVLADEPTGNLDADTGKQVLDLLEQLTRQSGNTLIMVTHSRENAAKADQIIELREGCLFEVENAYESYMVQALNE